MDSTNKTTVAAARTNLLGIRINMREEIGFHKHVLRLLGNPVNLNFWWSEKESVLLVSAADEPTDKSVPVPACFYTRKNGPRLRNRKLRMAIKALIGGGDNVVFKLRGEFIPELEMVAFRTDRTERLDQYEQG